MGFPIRISRFSRRRSAPPTLWTSRTHQGAFLKGGWAVMLQSLA